MDDTNYGAAIWGFTRGDVSSEEGAVQCFANLTVNSIILDLPFGRLLGEPGIRVIGKEA